VVNTLSCAHVHPMIVLLFPTQSLHTPWHPICQACRWFDFDSNCVISIVEYQRAYRALKESCAKHGEQRECFSQAGKRSDRVRHKRLGYDPQDTLNGDITESQKIGCAICVLASNPACLWIECDDRVRASSSACNSINQSVTYKDKEGSERHAAAKVCVTRTGTSDPVFQVARCQAAAAKVPLLSSRQHRCNKA
jgi:hypothetical protein